MNDYSFTMSGVDQLTELECQLRNSAANLLLNDSVVIQTQGELENIPHYST